MDTSTTLILVNVWYLFCLNVLCDDSTRLKLINLVRNPCKKVVLDNPAIVLARSEDTVLLPENEGEDNGCYSIGGPMRVTRKITGIIQIYVETRFSDSKPTVACHGESRDQCGGVGSCKYCDTCGTSMDSTSASSVRLQVIGKKFDCDQGLDAGNYTDLAMSFCLPTVEEYLHQTGISREKWKKMYKNGGQTIYQTFYIFNEAINRMGTIALRRAIAAKRNLLACDAAVVSVGED